MGSNWGKSKIVITVLAIVAFLIGVPFCMYQSALNATKKYLENNYAVENLTINRLYYDFTVGEFVAEVQSSLEVDVHFSVRVTSLGRVRCDTYDDVISGANTVERINGEYHDQIESVFNVPGSEYYRNPLTPEILRSISGELLISQDSTSNGIPLEKLELNGSYDVRMLGAQAGTISILYRDTASTYDRAAEILLDVKEKLDAAGIGFAQVSISLDGEAPGVEIIAFPAESIAGENLAQRLQAWAEN